MFIAAGGPLPCRDGRFIGGALIAACADALCTAADGQVPGRALGLRGDVWAAEYSAGEVCEHAVDAAVRLAHANDAHS